MAEASSGARRAVQWRELPPVVGPPEELIAGGAALLAALTPDALPVLRWYRASSPALILGRGQRAALPGDVGELTVVPRFTGGGAVLMDDGLLSLDVVLPAGHPWLDGAMTDVFLRVGSVWAAALRGLGVVDVTVHDAAGTGRRQGTPREQLLAAICYATLGYGEVTAGGRKLVGLAQRRRRNGALVQCGLLRRWEPRDLLAAFAADGDDEQIRHAAVGLDDLLAPPPSDEAVEDAVLTALQEAIAGS